MSIVWEFAAALLPTVGLLALFYLVIRSIIHADRNERLAMEKRDEETRATDVE